MKNYQKIGLKIRRKVENFQIIADINEKCDTTWNRRPFSYDISYGLLLTNVNLFLKKMSLNETRNFYNSTISESCGTAQRVCEKTKQHGEAREYAEVLWNKKTAVCGTPPK